MSEDGFETPSDVGKLQDDPFAESQREHLKNEAKHDHAGSNFGHGTELPYFGTRLFTLPNGQSVRFVDTIWSSLRSALIVEPFSDVTDWGAFTYAHRQIVAGTKDVIATTAHTNIPRDGHVGLPREWEMLVCRWRAAINMPLDQPVLDWAAETAVDFIYNDKKCGSETLADLILSGATMASQAGDQPVHVRENLSYSVVVRTENEKVMDQLRRHLGGDVTPNIHDAITALGVLEGMHRGSSIGEAIRDIQAQLTPGRNLTCWIHLEGPLVRTVV